MLTLYTASTPNGWKASVTLEALGLPYEVRKIDLRAGEQKQPEYLAICPNGRIPALVHDDFAIFESGAIMPYLAELTGRTRGSIKVRIVRIKERLRQCLLSPNRERGQTP